MNLLDSIPAKDTGIFGNILVNENCPDDKVFIIPGLLKIENGEITKCEIKKIAVVVGIGEK
jgi:hypothetical protein